MTVPSMEFILNWLRPLTIFVVSFPLIAGSVVLSTWARSEPHSGACRNQVFLSLDSQRDACVSPICSDELAQRCTAVSARWLAAMGNQFAATIHGPFVFVGNVSRAELDRWYAGTIRCSVEAMCREYFDCQITEPVSILLFGDESSYRQFASSHSGRVPASIYGYYKPATRTVVINLSAGGGTLVHELTHSLIDFDFPHAPLWLNEGMASMHEECRIERFGGDSWLIPLDNWRLPILQSAIRAGHLPTTRQLMDANFQGADEATCYAQARYVCLYLHEIGALDDVYRSLRDDPLEGFSAPAIVERVLRRDGFAGFTDFESQFRQWALERGTRSHSVKSTGQRQPVGSASASR